MAATTLNLASSNTFLRNFAALGSRETTKITGLSLSGGKGSLHVSHSHEGNVPCDIAAIGNKATYRVNIAIGSCVNIAIGSGAEIKIRKYLINKSFVANRTDQFPHNAPGQNVCVT